MHLNTIKTLAAFQGIQKYPPLGLIKIIHHNPQIKISRAKMRPAITVTLLVGLAMTFNANANYSCDGAVTYLGIDQGGDVVIAIGGTPIHKICNVFDKGSYLMTVPSCKLVYAAFLTAKSTGKKMVVYYNDNGFVCSTFPNWGPIHGVYFVQGPD
jgi:hypothetical protein